VPDNTLIEEGTEVIISNFNKHVFKKSGMKRKLSEEISRHFDDILRSGLINIFLSENGSNKIKLLPFDYHNMNGLEFPVKKIKMESRSKTSFLDIDLKILDQPQKNRLPTIKNKGRRIQSIADLQSYKKYLNSIGKNNYIWGNNEFIVGSIEINDFCSPKITRDDLIDNEERDIFYKKLVEIQEEIEELFNKKQYSKKQEYLDEISHKITNCLSNVMKSFKLKFEILESSQVKGQDDKESVVGNDGSNWGGDMTKWRK